MQQLFALLLNNLLRDNLECAGQENQTIESVARTMSTSHSSKRFFAEWRRSARSFAPHECVAGVDNCFCGTNQARETFSEK